MLLNDPQFPNDKFLPTNTNGLFSLKGVPISFLDVSVPQAKIWRFTNKSIKVWLLILSFGPAVLGIYNLSCHQTSPPSTQLHTFFFPSIVNTSTFQSYYKNPNFHYWFWGNETFDQSPGSQRWSIFVFNDAYIYSIVFPSFYPLLCVLSPRESKSSLRTRILYSLCFCLIVAWSFYSCILYSVNFFRMWPFKHFSLIVGAHCDYRNWDLISLSCYGMLVTNISLLQNSTKGIPPVNYCQDFLEKQFLENVLPNVIIIIASFSVFLFLMCFRMSEAVIRDQDPKTSKTDDQARSLLQYLFLTIENLKAEETCLERIQFVDFGDESFKFFDESIENSPSRPLDDEVIELNTYEDSQLLPMKSRDVFSLDRLVLESKKEWPSHLNYSTLKCFICLSPVIAVKNEENRVEGSGSSSSVVLIDRSITRFRCCGNSMHLVCASCLTDPCCPVCREDLNTIEFNSLFQRVGNVRELKAQWNKLKVKENVFPPLMKILKFIFSPFGLENINHSVAS